MRYLIEVLMAVIGAIGFSLLFNIHGKRIIITAIGGAVTWGTYLLTFELSRRVFVACLVATMASMIFAEIMARVSKTPVIILLVPMLVPMVPGGDLYRMMANVVMDESVMARSYGQTLIMEVGAIAFGIIFVSTVFQIIQRAQAHYRAARKRKS